MIELPLIALMISITGSALGFLAWQRKDERNRYAQERQIGHALDNFAAISTAVNQLEDKVEQGFQDVAIELSQVKTLMSIGSMPPDQQMASKARRLR